MVNPPQQRCVLYALIDSSGTNTVAELFKLKSFTVGGFGFLIANEFTFLYKLPSPIVVTFSGIIIDDKEKQSWKQSFPIFFKEFGRMILLKLLQS